MDASSQLPQKSPILQVAWEEASTPREPSCHRRKGTSWQGKCCFQIGVGGGEGRQTKKRADLRGPTLRPFPVSRGGCEVPASSHGPMSLQLSETDKAEKKHTFGFLRLVPLSYVRSPKAGSCDESRQGSQVFLGIWGREEGREGNCPPPILNILSSPFPHSLPGCPMMFLEHSESGRM